MFVCFHGLPEHLKGLQFLLSDVFDELMFIDKVIHLEVLLFEFVIEPSVPIYHPEEKFIYRDGVDMFFAIPAATRPYPASTGNT